MPADALLILFAVAIIIAFLSYGFGYYMGGREARRAARQALGDTMLVTLPPLPEGATSWRIHGAVETPSVEALG